MTCPCPAPLFYAENKGCSPEECKRKLEELSEVGL
jgi:hypothetical protein